MGCVDTLSQTGIIASLRRVSSVDTTSSRVDTLEKTAKQVFWERHLVATPSDTICDDPTSKLAQQLCQLVDFPGGSPILGLLPTEHA
ncbi:hypothetical protein Taro_015820 [Colocasia esculenta]|uniref:Uncharacterized protein n=1 Tax=Colocasia esculenta TaxID=4460 RepID=A0A843UCB8_COLES|nr:hypothetical protein [Colocasia esculenta]